MPERKNNGPEQIDVAVAPGSFDPDLSLGKDIRAPLEFLQTMIQRKIQSFGHSATDNAER